MQRKIPLKNYVIVTILFLMTFLVCIYLVMWYKSAEEYKKNNSDVLNILKEVKEVDWDNYIVENPNIIVYIMNGKGNNVDFEKKFREYIIEHNLSKSIIYINIETDNSQFKTYLNNFFSDELKEDNIKINTVPNIIVLDKGKIVDILYENWSLFHYDDAIEIIERHS